jgi:FK506-binding protein 4/5
MIIDLRSGFIGMRARATNVGAWRASAPAAHARKHAHPPASPSLISRPLSHTHQNNPPHNSNNPQPDGGVKKTITVAGDGYETPEAGDEVSVHYTGTLLDGTKFDSSRDRGSPFVFKLGQGAVIKGWDVGVATMTKGQRATLVCAPEYAYGSAGSPPKIPANATLSFDVELLSWKSVKDIAGDGGVIKAVTVEGSGWKTPTDRDEVRVKFSLKAAEGGSGELTSPGDGSEEAVFTLGSAPAKGLAVALRTMKKGEAATLTLKPPYTGAGDDEKTGGPTLTGPVELVGWAAVEDVTPDGGVVKKVLVDTESWQKATPGSTVKVKLTATALGPDGQPAGKPFTENEALEFIVDEEQVPDGLDKAVATMAEGERALVTASAAYAYGETGGGGPDGKGVPPGCGVRWDVTLEKLTKAKESWEMDDAEKVEAAATAKEKGNAAFKAGKWEAAIKKYKRALGCVEYDTGFGAEAKSGAADLKKAVNLNLAAAHLKLGAWKEAAAAADAVLAKDGSHAKALFRRAQARLGTQDFLDAERDARAAVDADPASREARALLARVKKEAAAFDKKERAAYANMFARLSKLEAKEAKAAKMEVDDGGKAEEKEGAKEAAAAAPMEADAAVEAAA